MGAFVVLTLWRARLDIDIEDVKDEYVGTKKNNKLNKSYYNPFDNVNKDPSVKKIQTKKQKPPVNRLEPQRKEIIINPYQAALQKYYKKNKTIENNEIIDLLTPFVGQHPDHIFAMKLLSAVLIELGYYKEAIRYFQNILSINKNDIESLNALAYFELLDGKTETSVNHLLDAIYIDDKNQKLKDNLEKLRSIKDVKVFTSMNKPGDFIFINIPDEPLIEKLFARLTQVFHSKYKNAFIVFSVLLILGLFFYLFYPVLLNFAQNYNFTSSIGKNRITRVTIKDIDKMVQERQNVNLKLSPLEVKNKFEMIRGFMEEKRYNRAHILVNELLNSNADDMIKERVMIMESLIPEVQLESIDFVPQTQDVLKLPFLYKDVAIRWSGTIANMEHIDRKETAFDLLINFVNDGIVDGIAECHYEGFQKVMNKDKIAVFGTIAGITMDNKIVIKGKQIISIGSD